MKNHDSVRVTLGERIWRYLDHVYGLNGWESYTVLREKACIEVLTPDGKTSVVPIEKFEDL